MSTALFRNEKDTAQSYIRKLNEELLQHTDSGKKLFLLFLLNFTINICLLCKNLSP